MPAPKPTKLFHITAIANLSAICNAGALLSKNHGAAAGINYQNIAHQGVQSARAGRAVPNPPGGVVHDFVPFYFAPRSPMLYAIHGGRVVDCQYRQQDIVHWVTTVERVTANHQQYVFYDRNATLSFSQAYTNLALLDEVIAWDLLLAEPSLGGYCKYWRSDENYPDRMERRQAEFLLKDRVPLSDFLGIGVYDEIRANEVRGILAAQGGKLTRVGEE
jgi:hypothetical protein